MGILIKNNIVNQKGTPAFYESSLATRPVANIEGRMFIDTDVPSTGIYRDNGTSWNQVADPGAGTTGTLQQVTTNGSSTNVGISVSANGIGIGTTIPGINRLDIHTGSGINATFNGTGTTNAALQLQSAGVGKWTIQNNYNAGANDLLITDNLNSINRISLTNAGVLTLTGNEVINKTLTTITNASSLDTSVSYTPTTTITDVNSYGFISRYKLNLTNGLYNTTTTTNATGIFSFINIDGNNGSISTQPIRAITTAFSVTSAAIKLSEYRSIQVNTLDSVSVTGNTITNVYGLYISQLKGSTNFTVTNGYGIYQAGISDNNYFAGKLGIVTTLPTGNFGIGDQSKLVETSGITLGVGYGVIEFIGSSFGAGYGIKLWQNSERSFAIAGRAGSTSFTDYFTVYDTGKINISTISTYASNALALAGGLVAGDIYKGATGILSIVY